MVGLVRVEPALLVTTGVLVWSIASEKVIFFFNDTATTEIYTLSLHDALPISVAFWVSTLVPVETVGAATWVLPARSLAPDTLKVMSERETTPLKSGHSYT